LGSIGVTQCKSASSGKDALRFLSRNEVDVVFLDWEMANGSGIELLKKVRHPSFGPMAFVPIIMVTAHADAEHVIEARDAGVHEFLVKPLTGRLVLQRLQSVIKRPRPFVRSDQYFGPRRGENDPAPMMPFPDAEG
jgi:DNA-binding response OmpR family regulator